MINRYFKYTALVFALALLLGHALVPHRHDPAKGTLVFSRHIQSPSLIMLMEVALSQDLGSEHLEEFMHDQTTLSFFKVFRDTGNFLAPFFFLNYVADENQHHLALIDEMIHPIDLRYRIGLRGPPVA